MPSAEDIIIQLYKYIQSLFPNASSNASSNVLEKMLFDRDFIQDINDLLLDIRRMNYSMKSDIWMIIAGRSYRLCSEHIVEKYYSSIDFALFKGLEEFFVNIIGAVAKDPERRIILQRKIASKNNFSRGFYRDTNNPYEC